MQCRYEQFDSTGDHYFLKGHMCLEPWACLILTQIITSSSNSWWSWWQRLSHVYMHTYLISRCCKCVSICHLMINIIVSFDLWWHTCSFVPYKTLYSVRIHPFITKQSVPRAKLPDKWDDTVHRWVTRQTPDKDQNQTLHKYENGNVTKINLLRSQPSVAGHYF